MPGPLENLIRCGVPMFSSSALNLTPPTSDFLIQNLRELCQQLQRTANQLDDRSKEACQAWILAIQTEFPTFYAHLRQSIAHLDLFVPTTVSGRLIRLRRQAVAVLATYL